MGYLPPDSLGLVSHGKKHGEVLKAMDENIKSSLKFHHLISPEHSGFAFTGALLTRDLSEGLSV